MCIYVCTSWTNDQDEVLWLHMQSFAMSFHWINGSRQRQRAVWRKRSLIHSIQQLYNLHAHMYFNMSSLLSLYFSFTSLLSQRIYSTISCWSRSEFRIFVRRFVPSPYVYKRRQEELALWKRLNKRKCKSQQTAFEDGECVNNSPWWWQLAVVIPKSAFSRRSRRPNTLQSATHTFGGTRWRDKHQSAYQQIFFFQINFLLSHHINFLSVA